MDFIRNELENYGLSGTTVTYLASIIMILFIAAVCILFNFITKKVILKIITPMIMKNKYTWDNIVLEKKVFHKLSHLVPAIIVYSSGETFPKYQYWIEKSAVIYITIIIISIINASLNALDAIYHTYPISKVRPIKGYIQVVKIVLYIIGGISVISSLIGQNPLILISGLGALSAVFMLIFKDSILGLVAGVQLSSNDMVRVGDWIEMPKYHADGDVIEITLNTVKVMNFDKTITMLPSYALISDSFKNWRGMQTAGGRRIKRSLYIDTTSIQFCTPEMIEAFKKIHFLKDYVTTRMEEIEQYNNEHQIDTSSKVNGRQLTNIGVFRIYVQQYLKHHPKIHQQLTLLVRQLAPGDSGLPLEIYAFTNDTTWAIYESVQADIFDHIFAVAPEFGLRTFQSPTGHDISSMLQQDDPEQEQPNQVASP
ncbi:mechanosensitive ion channel family protein [Paenibacillus yanchengensis]|uniref:Mechanosensitive ion channel family protein n=1 Tax=Paenibacillus yanchengensis TaxID=2035833 RepID=A0ABW4YN35_9BACL